VWLVATVVFNEIVVHHWDIRAAREPDARLNPEAVPLLIAFSLRGVPLLGRGEKTDGTWQLDVEGPGGGPVTLTVAGDQASAQHGPAARPDARVALDGDALVRLTWGRLDMAEALASGRVRVDGDRERALALQRLFPGG
jgi:hypothetical protein